MMTEPRMRTLTILGSTGSIGTNTLDVVRRNSHLYQVYALAAGVNVPVLVSQILEFRPRVAVVANSNVLATLIAALECSGLPRPEWPQLQSGDAARVEISTAAEIDTVISAIVGVAGLEATYEAVRRGKRI